MRRSNGLLGLIGVMLLVFAGVAAWLTGMNTMFDSIYVFAHAGAGALALIAYFSTGLDNLREFLGERSTRYGTSTVLAQSGTC